MSERIQSEDAIRIHRLRAVTRIGVPNSERSEPQEVEISIRMVPKVGFSALKDEVAQTVDYYEVSRDVLKLAATGERKLIETLAEDVASALLQGYPLAEIWVEIRKFILPETEYVAVEISRKP